MRLFEAIIDANHRAADGDNSAGLHPADFADALPVIALTCIDPRLNALFPNALGLPGDQFIWLRNAGNIIYDPMSSMTRTLALACAVKGGEEIAIIGHTDCLICKTTTMSLLDSLKALGVDRSRLPDNLNEFFGITGSERQNVIRACDLVRGSPLIGPKIPVHGLIVDVGTGRLEWIVNGYDTLQTRAPGQMPKPGFPEAGTLGTFKNFDPGVMKFPETKIGDLAAKGPAQPPAIFPGADLASSTARTFAEALEKQRYKPAAPPTLPPGKKRLVPPPPIHPRPTFHQ